jgi:hypothetical protein
MCPRFCNRIITYKALLKYDVKVTTLGFQSALKKQKSFPFKDNEIDAQS